MVGFVVVVDVKLVVALEEFLEEEVAPGSGMMEGVDSLRIEAVVEHTHSVVRFREERKGWKVEVASYLAVVVRCSTAELAAESIAVAQAMERIC